MNITKYDKYYFLQRDNGQTHILRRDLESFGEIMERDVVRLEMAEEIIRLKNEIDSRS